MMITAEIYFEIEGEEVNGHIDGASISTTAGRGYNVATLSSDRPFPLGASVEMAVGERSFSGFIYRVSRTKSNGYTIECRSETARLTTPFDPDQELFEPATSTSELCTLFSQRSGIAIDYQSAELHFGRSFKRSGTMLDSLLSVARVTGSSVVCSDDNTLIISPRDVPDTGVAKEVHDSEIVDFSSDTGSLESFGISRLTVSSDSSEVSTRQKREIEVDNCTGRFVLYAVPHTGISFSMGVRGFEETTMLIEEERVVDSASSMELKSEVVNVQAVRVNGFKIFDGYRVEDCFIIFDPEVTGKVSVTYEGMALRGEVDPTSTPAGLWWLMRGEHNGEQFSEQGFLKCDNRTCDPLPCVGDTTNVACVFMPERRNYVEGFSFWIYGGSPVARSVGATLSMSRHNDVYTATLDATCESFVGSNGIQTRVKLSGVPVSIVKVHTEVTDTPTWEIDGEYIVFPRDYGSVKVAYTLNTVRFDVIGEDSPNEVKIEVANSCGMMRGGEYWKAYDLQGFDKYDLSSYPCVLGQPVPVDVAGEMGVLPNIAHGSTVTVMDVGSYVVDVFGYIFPTPMKNGSYKVDCRSVRKGGEIILKVNV